MAHIDRVPVLANRYHVKQAIGEGAYGSVSSARDVYTGVEVAVKRIEHVFESYSMATFILREMKLLRLLRGHENVIKVKDILVPADRFRFSQCFAVFELMPYDLLRVFTSSATLSGARIKYLMFQLLRGIRYIHSAGVVHRDLKPSNVLVDRAYRLKICDFGFARAAFRQKDNDLDNVLWSNYIGSRWYRAPELLLPQANNYSTGIDIWSAGCIFAEMLLREPMFPGAHAFDQFRKIIKFTGTPSRSAVANLRSRKGLDFILSEPVRRPANLRKLFPCDADPRALQLIAAMLEFDPNERISAHNALMSDYFKELRERIGFGPHPEKLREQDFEFEQRTGINEMEDIANIREEFLEEILFYHPEKQKEIGRTFPKRGCFLAWRLKMLF